MNKIMKFFKQSKFFIISVFLVGIVLILFWILPTEDISKDKNLKKIYFADNISRAHQIIINRFNKEYYGKIEVVPINLPFSKFSTNERKELLARTLRNKSVRIDVFTVDIIWVPRFAKWCQPLDEYFSMKNRNQIIDHVLKSCYYNNKFVAIPLYTDIGLMYYRSDIIEKLPNSDLIKRRLEESITWEEFIQLKSQFDHYKITNPFYIYPADNFEGLTCSFFEGVSSQNNLFLTGDVIQLNSGDVKKSLQLLVDMVNKYNMTPKVVTKFDEYEGYLYALTNDAVFIRGWPGFLRQHYDLGGDTSKFQNIKRVALPHFKDSKPSFVYGGWNFMISKYSTKKDAVIKFIKFALEEESQKVLFEEGGYIPIRKSIYQDSMYIAEHPDLNFYLKLLKHGVHRPYLEDYTKISDVLSYYTKQAIENKITVDAALNQAEQLINSKQVLLK